jgi:NADH dehydrogenase
MRRPRVVIIGGGFGGINAARALRRAPVDITLVDRSNHHLFQPLLYQVATATLAPSDITVPIRWMLRRQPNARVLLANVMSVDLEAHTVHYEGEPEGIPWDYLIVATGSRHSYFGHDEWEPLAPGLKSLDDALEIRQRFLLTFERAEKTADPAEREALLTSVIVGGGPTGVELAGIMTWVAHDLLLREYRSIDTAQARVILLEGGPRVLPTFPEDLSEHTAQDLRDLGVEVRTGAMVTRVTPTGVVVGGVGEEQITARTVIWAAGNASSPLGRTLGAEMDRAGRVKVNADLSVPGQPNIFVVGDLATITDDQGRMVPGVAPAAMQEGRWAARNIERDLRKQPRRPFHYLNKGDLATIGRHRAVAVLIGMHFTGVVAWLLWLFVHIMYLAGFRNRLMVLVQWAYSYFTYSRGARVILGGRDMRDGFHTPTVPSRERAQERSAVAVD